MLMKDLFSFPCAYTDWIKTDTMNYNEDLSMKFSLEYILYSWGEVAKFKFIPYIFIINYFDQIFYLKHIL